jgi:gluconate 2-dehydrogenase gamma chain
MQRREFVEAMAAYLAAALAAARWAGQPATTAFAAEVPENAPYEFLTAEQARLLDAITSHIVPTDDTPGAREAHVVRFIDHAYATFFSDFRKDFTETLDEFNEFVAGFRADRAPFVRLPHAQQLAALRDLERLKPEVFRPLRDITMSGMFCHPEHGGNFQKVGWRLIGYTDQYSWAPPFGYYDRGRT